MTTVLYLIIGIACLIGLLTYLHTPSTPPIRQQTLNQIRQQAEGEL